MAAATKDNTFDGAFSTESVIVIVCAAISLYNAIELLLLIFVTFKRWGGLYFWSLFIATFAFLPYNIGFLVEFFRLTASEAGVTIDNIGWWMMVTGQAFVLYSRLHLVWHDRRGLRAVLCMIITFALIFHVPTTILCFGAHYAGGQSLVNFERGYKVYEKVQMTGFCVQEFILSGIYIWKTAELLQVLKNEGTRRTMYQLFIVNVIIVIMDIALLALEYRDLKVHEQAFKGVVYSVKVKLEYAILGKLVQITKMRPGNISTQENLSPGTGKMADGVDGEVPDFVDPRRRDTGALSFMDYTHATPGEEKAISARRGSWLFGGLNLGGAKVNGKLGSQDAETDHVEDAEIDAGNAAANLERQPPNNEGDEGESPNSDLSHGTGSTYQIASNNLGKYMSSDSHEEHNKKQLKRELLKVAEDSFLQPTESGRNKETVKHDGDGRKHDIGNRAPGGVSLDALSDTGPKAPLTRAASEHMANDLYAEMMRQMAKG